MSKFFRLNWIAPASSILIFVAILYFLSRTQKLDAIVDVWRRTDAAGFFIAIFFMLFVQAVSGYRLKVITGAEGLASIGYPSLLRIQFISQFIGYGAPVSALADLAKAAMLKLRFNMSLPQSIRYILYERICGALGAVVIGVLATVWQFALPIPRSLIEIQSAVWAAGLLALAAILVAGWLNISSGVALFDRAVRAVSALAVMLRHPATVGNLLLISLLQILGFTAVFSALARGMHIPVSWLDLLLFMPFIFLISALPIFYQGWGGREAAVILTIGSIGTISDAQSIALSVGFGVVTALSSLPGAVLWIMRPSMRKSVRFEIEQTGAQ